MDSISFHLTQDQKALVDLVSQGRNLNSFVKNEYLVICCETVNQAMKVTEDAKQLVNEVIYYYGTEVLVPIYNI